MSKKRRGLGIWILVTVVLIVGTLVSLSIAPTPRSYRFVTVDHPVDMWQDGSDKWAYFSIGKGTKTSMAESARKELLALGFTEDTSQSPWIRFVKGKQEVIVCHHFEFAVNGGRHLVKVKTGRPPGYTGEWPCVLVKNGPGTEMSMPVFKVNKLIHGW